jgi:TRAP-type C4-dicarboxylate transport system substrate-binding protein
MNSFRTMATVVTLAALVAGTGGCEGVDRAGGDAADPVTTLTFAQPNDEPPAQLTAWADRVEQASGGSLRIEFKNGWRAGQTDNESGTIADVKAGEVDLAWVGARVLDRVGVTDFQALLAPMLVDSHELQAAVFADGIPEEMLAGVGDAGVTGLGVLPGPMRKVLGVHKPFLEPDDFRGAVVGMQDSALTQTAMETVGATSKAEPSGAKLDGLDAYEQQLASIQGNGYVAQARYVTVNLDLWPRPLVLVANPGAFDALSDELQAALSRASKDAILPALDASRAEDEDAVKPLCQQGMMLVEATGQQLDALATAWQPVYDELATDPDTAGWIDRIRTLKESVGAAPHTAVCSSDETIADGDDPVAGDYVATIDWPNVDVPEECVPDPPEGTTKNIYELSLHDGTVSLSVRIGGPEAPAEHGYGGRYRVFRDQIELGDGTPLTANVDVTADRLVLSDMTGGQCGDAAIWTTSPWTRVDKPSATDELDGAWTTELSDADWSAAGFDGPAGTWTLEFGDGWVIGTQPDGQIGYQARYSAFRGRLVTSDSPDELRASFRVDGDELVLSDMTLNGSEEPSPFSVVWTSHPFTRQTG